MTDRVAGNVFIRYDHWRSDGDSDDQFVGPFDSREAAQKWAEGAWVNNYDPRYDIVPLRLPWFGTMQDDGKIR